MGDPVAEVKYLEGKIVSMRAHTHRHQEWLKFVKQIERETPADVGLHLMADNYARHRHSDVYKWLANATVSDVLPPTRCDWQAKGEEILRRIHRVKQVLTV